MLIPTLILVATALFIGVLSSAKEKVFLVVVFIGLPAIGFAMNFTNKINVPFHAPDGSGNWARAKDLFLQIPEEYRLGVYMFIPAFIFGRVLTWAFLSTRKERVLTPEKVRSKKKKILKSYSI